MGQADGVWIQVPGTNRQKFAQCSVGATAQTFTCSAEQIFNGVNGCEFKERVTTCLEDTDCNPEDPSGGGTSGCSDLTVSECATPCVGQADGVWIQVPGTNRQKFAQCYGGATAQTVPCPAEHIFNGVNGCEVKERVTTCLEDTVCNPEDPGGGGTSGCTDLTGSECATPCIGQDGGYRPGGMYQIAGTNRDKYVQCSVLGSGVPYLCSDLGPDYVFDSALSVCNLKTSATCGDDPVCYAPQPQLGTTKMGMLSASAGDESNDQQRLGSKSKQEKLDEHNSSQARVAGIGATATASAWIIMFMLMV